MAVTDRLFVHDPAEAIVLCFGADIGVGQILKQHALVWSDVANFDDELGKINADRAEHNFWWCSRRCGRLVTILDLLDEILDFHIENRHCGKVDYFAACQVLSVIDQRTGNCLDLVVVQVFHTPVVQIWTRSILYLLRW